MRSCFPRFGRNAARLALLPVAVAACGGDASGPGHDPGSGVLEITVTTTGVELDPDGYTLVVSGGTLQGIEIQSVVQVGVGDAPVSVELLQVSDNCSVAGENPRTVTVSLGDTVRTTFAVTCRQTSSIAVTVPTTGADLTIYEYRASVGGTHFTTVDANGSATLDRIPVGLHSVLLNGLPANCSPSGGNTQTVDVTAGSSAPAVFAVSCGPAVPRRFKLGFVRRHSLTDQGDIYVMNDDGTGVVNLTRSASDESAPAWSPNGGRIAFLRRTDVDQQLFIMAADGTDVRQLTSIPSDKQGPVWSPDGSLIALAGYQDVYLVASDGAGATNLTQSAGFYTSPTWSPGGGTLAFASDRTGAGDIYRMDVGGGNAVRLSDSPLTEIGPAWSPDGSQIAFLRSKEAPDPCDFCLSGWDVMVMGTDGSAPVTVDAVSDGVFDGLRWSPDGGRLAYLAYGDIRIHDADGSGFVRLGTPFPRSPTWSPDGSWLAVTSDGEVFLIRPDGSGLTQLTARLSPIAGQSPLTEDFTPAWNPAP